jgi:hypothetical protein
MARISPSDFKNRITFTRKQWQVNESTGEQVVSQYITKKNVWSKFTYIGTPSAGASEEEINDQRTGKVKAEIYCRHFDDVQFEDVIWFESSKFRIYSIQYEGNREFLKIRAELRDDDSPNGLPDTVFAGWDGDVPWPEYDMFNLTGLLGAGISDQTTSTTWWIVPDESAYLDGTREHPDFLEWRVRTTGSDAILRYEGNIILSNENKYYIEGVHGPEGTVEDADHAIRLGIDITPGQRGYKFNIVTEDLLSYNDGRFDLPYGYFFSQLEFEASYKELTPGEERYRRLEAIVPVTNASMEVGTFDKKLLRHGTHPYGRFYIDDDSSLKHDGNGITGGNMRFKLEGETYDVNDQRTWAYRSWDVNIIQVIIPDEDPVDVTSQFNTTECPLMSHSMWSLDPEVKDSYRGCKLRIELRVQDSGDGSVVHSLNNTVDDIQTIELNIL